MVLNRKVVGTLSGNIMEFYDFIIYAFLSPYIAKLFFDVNDNLTSLILTFGVFASGYLSRPIGAIFFGYLGDKYGRKLSLVTSIFMVTLSTVLIGLLPTYNTAGVLATFSLVICRLLQGFAVSGEEGGAAVYLCENFDSKNKGFLGALILGSAYFGVLLGSLLCLLLTMFLSEEQILAFGWRIPFLISIAFGVVSFWLRWTTEESAQYLQLKNKGNLAKNPALKVIKNNYMQILLGVCLVAALAIPIYFYTVFMPTYLTSILGFAKKQSLTISVLSLFILSIGVPIFGKLSDLIGHSKQFIIGCASLVLLSFPCFKYLECGSLFEVFIGLTILGVMIFFIAGPIFAILFDLFPVDVRFSGVSVVFNTSMTIFGSTAPIVGFYLIKVNMTNSAPWIYLAFAGVLGSLSLMALSTNYFRVIKLKFKEA